ncbi:MAG: hypothetical protein EHM42_09155, partial [Planctomycetaceae bacterium]
MSLTALAWCVLMLVLSVLALTRPIWGIATYILMLFANPNNWWWGKGTLEGFGHWTLTAGVVMLGSAVIGYRPQAKDGAPDVEPGVFRFLMVLYVANLVFVTFVFAADLNASMAILILQLKFLLLIICLDAAIRNEADFELFLM